MIHQTVRFIDPDEGWSVFDVSRHEDTPVIRLAVKAFMKRKMRETTLDLMKKPPQMPEPRPNLNEENDPFIEEGIRAWDYGRWVHHCPYDDWRAELWHDGYARAAKWDWDNGDGAIFEHCIATAMEKVVPEALERGVREGRFRRVGNEEG